MMMMENQTAPMMESRGDWHDNVIGGYAMYDETGRTAYDYQTGGVIDQWGGSVVTPYGKAEDREFWDQGANNAIAHRAHAHQYPGITEVVDRAPTCSRTVQDGGALYWDDTADTAQDTVNGVRRIEKAKLYGFTINGMEDKILAAFGVSEYLLPYFRDGVLGDSLKVSLT
jgi:hypothetical protein